MGVERSRREKEKAFFAAEVEEGYLYQCIELLDSLETEETIGRVGRGRRMRWRTRENMGYNGHPSQHGRASASANHRTTSTHVTAKAILRNSKAWKNIDTTKGQRQHKHHHNGTSYA